MQPRSLILEYSRRMRALLPCVLAALAACSVGPNFTRPAPPAAARYTSNTLPLEDNTSAGTQHVALGKQIEGDWWSLFGSDSIDGVVRQALEHNRTLEAAAHTLAQSHELAAAQAGLRYPQVGLTAGLGRQQYGAEFFGGDFTFPPSHTSPSARP